MKIINNLLIWVFLSTPFYAMGQNNCDFKIDTSVILKNKNLTKFIDKLQSDTFTTYYDVKEIPIGIKNNLDCLTKSFSITNPNKEYACCCTSSKELPERQLITMFKSHDLLVLFYLTGGAMVTTHIVLINFENDKILDLWAGHSWDNLKTTEETAKYLKENKKKKWGLNTNILYF